MKAYEALTNYVILKPLKAVETSAGGIVLPDKAKNQFGDDAEVVSVGDEVSIGLQVGDIVLRPDPARIEITDDATGEILLICSEEDIMAKVAKDDLDYRKFLPGPDGTVQEVTHC